MIDLEKAKDDWAHATSMVDDANWANTWARDLLDEVERLQDQNQLLRHALKLAIPYVEETLPTINHICGDPNAQCDMDCVNAARTAQDLGVMRRAL